MIYCEIQEIMCSEITTYGEMNYAYSSIKIDSTRENGKRYNLIQDCRRLIELYRISIEYKSIRYNENYNKLSNELKNVICEYNTYFSKKIGATIRKIKCLYDLYANFKFLNGKIIIELLYIKGPRCIKIMEVKEND